MTVLRRMAQLVSDLQELNAIRKRDGDIVFYNIDEGNPTISIELSGGSDRFLDERVIRRSIIEEFSDNVIERDDVCDHEGNVCYKIIPKNS